MEQRKEPPMAGNDASTTETNGLLRWAHEHESTPTAYSTPARQSDEAIEIWEAGIESRQLDSSHRPGLRWMWQTGNLALATKQQLLAAAGLFLGSLPIDSRFQTAWDRFSTRNSAFHLGQNRICAPQERRDLEAVSLRIRAKTREMWRPAAIVNAGRGRQKRRNWSSNERWLHQYVETSGDCLPVATNSGAEHLVRRCDSRYQLYFNFDTVQDALGHGSSIAKPTPQRKPTTWKPQRRDFPVSW